MCGIFGFIRSTPAVKSQLDFMADSFVAGQLRGPHGTGVMVVGPEYQVIGHSEPVTGAEFIRSEAANPTLMKIAGSRAAIGHNRFTTSGQNISDHCHPFQYDHIMGVHNGTIPSWVLQRIDPQNTHPVDSARLYSAIGRAEDPIEVLTDVSDGAYALVWYNSKTRTVHMARNWERPLHVLQSMYGVYFASERGMLEWVAGRNGLFSAKDQIAALATESLYSIPLEDTSKVSSVKYTPKQFGNSWGSAMSAAWGHESYRTSRVVAPPVASPYQTYFSLTHLRTQHPQLKAKVEAVNRNLLATTNSVMPMVNVILMNQVTSMEGQVGCGGFVVVPEKAEVEYTNPVFVKLGTAGYLKHFGNMLPPDRTLESLYPCVPCLIDRFLVTADGEVIIVARPPTMCEPIQHYFKITPEQAASAITRVENDALTYLAADQIMGLWKTTLQDTAKEAVL